MLSKRSIYSGLGPEGKILFKVYMKVLAITKKDVENILRENETAELFLHQEEALSHTGDLENIKVLVRITLLREYGDLSAITDIDKKFLLENYGLKVNKAQNSKKYTNTLEILELFETIRGIPCGERNSELLKKIIKNTNEQLRSKKSIKTIPVLPKEDILPKGIVIPSRALSISELDEVACCKDIEDYTENEKIGDNSSEKDKDNNKEKVFMFAGSEK